MIVMNLAVLVTWFLRSLGFTGEEDTDHSTARTPSGRTLSSHGGKDLTTLRFHPIVLQSLGDDQGNKTFGSTASADEHGRYDKDRDPPPDGETTLHPTMHSTAFKADRDV